jgi:DNA-binding Lrp family transcriptional regulator
MRDLVAARDWLTVFQLPAYAPELNPVEPVWSNLKRSLANLVKQDIGQLTALVKSRLRRMQYQPGLLEGFLAKPRLDLHPNLADFDPGTRRWNSRIGTARPSAVNRHFHSLTRKFTRGGQHFVALRRGVYAARRRRRRVVEAFMLIQTEVGRAEVVAKQMAGLAGVLSAEYVTGPYDVVVRIGADTMSDLQDNVVPNVQQIAGITRTLTCPIANGARP